MKTILELQREFLLKELIVEGGQKAFYADIFERWKRRRVYQASGENMNEAIDALLAEDAIIKLNVFRVGRLLIGVRLRRMKERRARSIGARLSKSVDSPSTDVS